MIRNILLFMLGSLLLSSCFSSKNLYITSLENSPELKKVNYVYATSRDKIEVNIETLMHSFYSGPYKDYALRYLGITDVIEKDVKYNEFSTINISTITEPDANNYYAVYCKIPNALNAFADLSEQGLISKDIPTIASKDKLLNAGLGVQPPIYTDLSVKKSVRFKNDTLYRAFETDTGFMRIPYIKKKSQQKNLETKAEEAANYILKIKKRRFKLVSGQYENYQKGDALALSIAEMNKLEDEYLSLFIGKSFTRKNTISLTVDIIDSLDIQTIILGYFSPQKGFSIEKIPGQKPVEMTVSKLPVCTAIDSTFAHSKTNIYKNQIPYKVPGKAEVKIIYDKELIAKEEIILHQFGAVLPLYTGKIKK